MSAPSPEDHFKIGEENLIHSGFRILHRISKTRAIKRLGEFPIQHYFCTNLFFDVVSSKYALFIGDISCYMISGKGS
jgi:hypothetical protein